MSDMTASRTDRTLSEQDALWGKVGAALPIPYGTPGSDVLKGTNGVDGFYGMGGNDTFYGYGGTDAIAGGPGNDKLSGGKGMDYFFFDTKLSATTNVDTIMDFSASDDTFGLSRSIFSKIASGPLNTGAFCAGKKAHDKDDRIVYDKATGALCYDPDGSGSAVQIKFAVLANKVAITYKDFVIA